MPTIRTSVISQAIAATASTATIAATSSRRSTANGAAGSALRGDGPALPGDATESTLPGEVRPETRLGPPVHAERLKIRASVRLAERYLAVREPGRGHWMEVRGPQLHRRPVLPSVGDQVRDPEAALVSHGQLAVAAFGGELHRSPLHPEIFANHARERRQRAAQLTAEHRFELFRLLVGDGFVEQ